MTSTTEKYSIQEVSSNKEHRKWEWV